MASYSSDNEKIHSEHHEHLGADIAPAFTDGDHEPELHSRTWLAFASMCVIQYVQISALLGPPTALTYIARDLNGSTNQNWVVNVTTLAQAALGPILSSVSDKFQSRKLILVAACTVAMIGSAIAPGSKGIYRLIAAQVLIGLGLASAPLSYAVPSEILPRKWRPVAQAAINTCGAAGAVSAPLILGAFLHTSPGHWRYFYWMQTALWGLATVGLLAGYLPPVRHTRYDDLSVMQKLLSLDLIGSFLFTCGVTLFITGLNLGGNLFPWTHAETLGPLISGILALILFGIYETWGTKTGILDHRLFGRQGPSMTRSFVIYCALFFLEGAMYFATAVWYPVIIAVLFETDPLLQAACITPLNATAVLVTMIYGTVSTKAKSIRWPLLVGFALWTGGLIGQSTLQPGQLATALGTIALLGVGLAGPLILILAGVQLTIPPDLMATGSAAVVCTRALGATIFTAIYGAAVNGRLNQYLPKYIANAVLPLGLAPSSLGLFIRDLSTQDFSSLESLPGVTPQIIAAGAQALQQAFVDAIRVVFIVGAALGGLACVLCFCLQSLKHRMDYQVDGPVETLHAKVYGHGDGKTAMQRVVAGDRKEASVGVK